MLDKYPSVPSGADEDPLPPLPPLPGVSQEVSDPDRTATLPPVAFERSDANVIDIYRTLPYVEQRNRAAVRTGYTLPLSKRIVIDGIPKRDLTDGALITDRCIQVYRNKAGYLMAERVGLDDQTGVPTEVETSSGEAIGLGTPVAETKLDYPNGGTLLLGCAFKYPQQNADGTYSGMYEAITIEVDTPDDHSDQLRITMLGSQDTHQFPEPILVRLVDDIPAGR